MGLGAYGRLWAMVSSARTPRSTTLNEQLLIMRLITSVGLALLLMLGLAATGHTEAACRRPAAGSLAECEWASGLRDWVMRETGLRETGL